MAGGGHEEKVRHCRNRSSMAGFCLVLLAILPLAGCGFRPLYGGGNALPDNPGVAAVPVAEMLNRTDIVPIPDRIGQQLHNLLLDRFYRTGEIPDQEVYRLTISLETQEKKMGIRKDETSTRSMVTVSARMVLQDIASQRQLYTATSRVKVSYNLLVAAFATYASQDYAYRRALNYLADDITTRIALYYSRPETAVAADSHETDLDANASVPAATAPNGAPGTSPVPLVRQPALPPREPERFPP